MLGNRSWIDSPLISENFNAAVYLEWALYELSHSKYFYFKYETDNKKNWNMKFSNFFQYFYIGINDTRITKVEYEAMRAAYSTR